MKFAYDLWVWTLNWTIGFSIETNAQLLRKRANIVRVQTLHAICYFCCRCVAIKGMTTIAIQLFDWSNNCTTQDIITGSAVYKHQSISNWTWQNAELAGSAGRHALISFNHVIVPLFCTFSNSLYTTIRGISASIHKCIKTYNKTICILFVSYADFNYYFNCISFLLSSSRAARLLLN